MGLVEMTCMTTKKKFVVEDPDVVVLRNNKYAFKTQCPWPGKNNRVLWAYKFCSARDHEAFVGREGVNLNAQADSDTDTTEDEDASLSNTAG